MLCIVVVFAVKGWDAGLLCWLQGMGLVDIGIDAVRPHL